MVVRVGDTYAAAETVADQLASIDPSAHRALADAEVFGDGADGPKSLGLDIEIFAHR